MSIKQHFTHEQARQFGDEFGFDWERSCASVEQLTRESDIDLERGLYFPGDYPRAKVKGWRPSSPVKTRPPVSPGLPIKAKLRKE